MSFLIKPYERDWTSLSWQKGVFTPAECEAIKNYYNIGNEQISATISDSTIKSGNSLFVVPTGIRKSKQVWLPWSPEVDWIFQRLTEVATQINYVKYGFQLSGFVENLQITKYESGGHYKWHQDTGPGPLSLRKLSISAQLSAPADYEGGEFEVFEDPTHIQGTKDLGDVLVFPSYQVHRVKPVTKGTRFSLVAWIGGEPYR